MASLQKQTDMVIDKLINHHAFWHNHNKEKCQFNYGYLRKRDSALVSAIERKSVGILGLENAFELAGINPFCHLSGVLYGKKKSRAQRKARYIKVLYHLMLTVDGPENLNDLTVNSDGKFQPPALLQKSDSYPICEEYGCEILPVTYRSIYAQGRRMFGNWASALNAAGFHYARIRRKRPEYPRAEVMQDLLQFHAAKQRQYSIQNLREQDFALYKGIFNSHEYSPFKFANLSVMETAFLELQYYIKKQVDPKLSIAKFWKTQKLVAHKVSRS